MLALGGGPLVEMDTIELDDWLMELGPHFIGAEVQRDWAFICSYRTCFAFSLDDVEDYKGKSIHIEFEDDHPIFKRP